MKQCGVGVQGQARVESHFFLSPPSLSACPVHPCLRFWRNPTVCTAQTSGLLKQPNQVELSYCKCSPSGVSHFQGPHEHMRHSCETGRRKRGGGYIKQLWNSSLCVSHLVFGFDHIFKNMQYWMIESKCCWISYQIHLVLQISSYTSLHF